ncbi:hypothetical protein [Chryseobacterium glaciei]|nr:hypothetical protein [Chryseobacterium glaciei]
MNNQQEFTPQNPNGQIIQINVEEDLLQYLDKDDLQKMNDSMPENQKVQDFSPFFTEYVETDIFMVNTDVVY